MIQNMLVIPTITVGRCNIDARIAMQRDRRRWRSTFFAEVAVGGLPYSDLGILERPGCNRRTH
jgi:hypothetical protein